MSSSSFANFTPQQRLVAKELLRKKIDEMKRRKQAAIDALALLECEAKRRRCDTLKGFVHHFWHVVEPTRSLQWNWHLDLMCEDLEAMARGDWYREIFNVPPGTMKSLLVSVFLRPWLWRKDASLRFFTGSYSDHLSLRDNVKVRLIVESKEYKELFPDVQLAADQSAKGYFKTTQEGWSFATSVGGAGTGEHPHWVIIDDPHTALQAESDVERQDAINWVDRTLSTRGVVLDVRVIVIMQRLHQQDLTGHLIAKGGWKHRVFKMKYEKEEINPETGNIENIPDPDDPRTEEGELLWPSLFTPQKVRQLEIDLGPYGAAGQLQQRPSPKGGGLFKRAWFKFVDVVPKGKRNPRYCRGWDTAATEGGGDYSAGVKIAEVDGFIYVADVVRGQVSPAGLDELMKATADLDGRHTMQREEKEGGASGTAIISYRARLLRGHDYKSVPTNKSKPERAKPFRSQAEAGNVYIVRGPWNEAYLQQLADFPTGGNDDMVDGTSAAYNALVEEAPAITSLTWGSRRRAG